MLSRNEHVESYGKTKIRQISARFSRYRQKHMDFWRVYIQLWNDQVGF